MDGPVLSGVLILRPSWFFGGSSRDDGPRYPAHHARRGDETAPVVGSQRPLVVERIRAGDVSVYETLYLQYAEPLWSFARRYVHSSEAAEDVVHDVFLSVWARRVTWDPPDVESYLFRAVLNRALQVGRHAGVVHRMTKDATALRAGAGTIPAPDDATERRSDTEWLARALAMLPERARIALRLRWYDDMSYAQIGTVLGIAEDAARKAVRRALAVLRERVEETDRK